MAEIMARVSAGNLVELIDERATVIKSAPMVPRDAAYLGRGLLACAAVMSGPNPPPLGFIAGDAHLPILKWVVTTASATGQPVLMLSIPGGVELTFAMTPQTEKRMAEHLRAHAAGEPPPADRPDTVH